MRSEDEVLDGLQRDFSHPFVKPPISEERGDRDKDQERQVCRFLVNNIIKK
jgi:hypothetical protein